MKKAILFFAVIGFMVVLASCNKSKETATDEATTTESAVESTPAPEAAPAAEVAPPAEGEVAGTGKCKYYSTCKCEAFSADPDNELMCNCGHGNYHHAQK